MRPAGLFNAALHENWDPLYNENGTFVYGDNGNFLD